MGADDGRVEDQPLQVGVLQGLEQQPPGALPGPAVETLPDGVPVAEAFGQVAPGDAGSGPPQDGVDEEAVVLGQPAGLAGPSRQQVLDAVPVGIRDGVAVRHGRPSVASGEGRSLPKPPRCCPHGLAEKDFPVFMEAKRARLWYPDLTLGTARPDPNLQVGSVQSDVSKLRDERSQRKKDGKEDINCQLIVWGICETDSNQDDPYQFFRDVGNGVLMHQLRWLPLKWQCPSTADIRASKVLLPVVERALWIALAEVDPPTP